VEESDEGTFKFWATASVYGCGGESLPDDGFADVGGNEERDAGSEAVALLEELVEEDDDEGGRDELYDEEKTYACTEI